MNTAYVLNPDIAIPTIIEEHAVNEYGAVFDIPYDTVQVNLDKIQDRGEKLKQDHYRYTGIVYAEMSKLMKPFLELVRWKQPVERVKRLKYYTIRKVIDSLTWQNLSSIGKQYYVPIESLFKERYRVTAFYAGLGIPPRGSYTQLYYKKSAKNIKVNGQTSKIPAGCARMLVRLRDGSLLEVYGLNYDPTEHLGEVKLLYSIIERLLSLEPTLAKRYFFSLALTNELMRPAYRLNLLLKKGILEL